MSPPGVPTWCHRPPHLWVEKCVAAPSCLQYLPGLLPFSKACPGPPFSSPLCHREDCVAISLTSHQNKELILFYFPINKQAKGHSEIAASECLYTNTLNGKLFLFRPKTREFDLTCSRLGNMTAEAPGFSSPLPPTTPRSRPRPRPAAHPVPGAGAVP